MIRDELRGFILLDVTITDKEFLKTMVSQIGMSIENARLYQEAIVDGLTGLYVHRYFEIQLSIEIKRAYRFGKNLAMLMLDIDFFKKFNDTYGHQAGDYVLREVAAIIKTRVRAADIVSRYGGEEMAIILPETDINGAYVIAETIRTIIESHEFVFQQKKMQVTVSIGAAAIDNKAPITSEHMVSCADEAMYAAKKEGRNRVCLYSKNIS
jgi:diguanylate cyclase (GGDEF)-like protein